MKIDNITRVMLLSFIRKYDKYKAEIDYKRAEIMSIGVQDYTDMDMPRGTDVQDGVTKRVEALDRLMKSHKAQIVLAIDQAKTTLPDDLKEPIWLSCLNGRRYAYEVFELFYSRSSFYLYKKRFLWQIKETLNL